MASSMAGTPEQGRWTGLRGPRTEAASHGAGWALPLFAVAFALAFLVPPFTPFTFGPYPVLRWGDVLDLATPALMLPMYWMVLAHRRGALPRWEMLAFLVLGAIWIEGQGVHLAANAIGHHELSGAARETGHFFDEKLGHILWHGAALGLAALIVTRGFDTAGDAGRPGRLPVLFAAAVYGFSFFLIGVEGATGILVATGSIVILALALSRGPRALWANPTVTVFGVAHALTLVLLGIWFAYWGGSLPEFSALGLIK